MPQTSMNFAFWMRSKWRSFDTRIARSCRQVAAWRMSAGSGVVTYRRHTARKFSWTRTNRVFSMRALTMRDAVSDRNSSAYRSISSSHRSLPTSARSSRRRNSNTRRSVAVSRRGCFTAATKTFASSKKIRVPPTDKGPHLLPDLPDDGLDVGPGELLLALARPGLDVHLLQHQPPLLPRRPEQLRALA